MNYKDLLNRYKKGLASEEEKQIVEKELEKYEAFEEYASEIFDENFDDMTQSESMDIHNEETSKLKKSVNKRLRRVVLTSVLAVIGLYFIVFYVISGIVDKAYYDPTAVSQPDVEGYQFEDLYYDMRAYVSLNMPGYSINSFTFQESKGFGKYEISYPMRDLFTTDDQRYFFNFSRGKRTLAMDGIFSNKNLFWLWEGFEKIKYPNNKDKEGREISERFTEKYNEETITYLNELNPLSYISMSIVFDEDLTMEEFYYMSNEEYPTINYKWLGIRTIDPDTSLIENQPIDLIGFNPNFNDEPSSSQRPDPEEYPYFYLSDVWDDLKTGEEFYPEAMAEAYEAHFKSRLKYLRSREKFIKIFDYNELKIDFYDEALEYIEDNGVKAYGVLAYGRADEFLKYIDNISYDSIYINKVLPAKPNIYYD